MSKKSQHFVPQTYLKAWEGTVISSNSPNKPFTGVYYFEGDSQLGEGRNKDSVLWQPNLYTISFDQRFIGEGCSKVTKDFVNQVDELMKNRSPEPVYGKVGYSVIKNKASIRKHLDNIDEWEFYYYDGRKARKNGILKDIHGLSSYLLEDGFDSVFETKWTNTLSTFVEQVNAHRGLHKDGKDFYVTIDPATAYDVYAFFQMLECRSPRFDGFGILSWINDELLSAFEGETESFMQGIWYTELYRMLYMKKVGFYHAMLKSAIEKCQMVCIEAIEGEGTFITSDNPVFLNETRPPEAKDMTGYIFPVSPRYLLYMCKGHGGYNSMMLRWAGRNDIKKLNSYIYRNRDKAIVSTERELKKIL